MVMESRGKFLVGSGFSPQDMELCKTGYGI